MHRACSYCEATSRPVISMRWSIGLCAALQGSGWEGWRQARSTGPHSVLSSSWVEVEPATVEQDGHAEVAKVSVAPSPLFEQLNRRIQTLADGIGDRMQEVVHHPVDVPLHHLGHLLDGLQSA